MDIAHNIIERKSRMPHIRGIKCEAVVICCEPLIRKEMRYHRQSWTVIDSPNPTYPIEPHTPSNIHEKIQDVFLNFYTTEKNLSAVEFYQNISNINRLTEDENQDEKRRSRIHMYG